MHFISQERHNPNKGCDDRYYRIKESYRDVMGKVHSYVLLNVGFLENIKAEDIRDIGYGLTYLSKHQNEQDIFGNPFEKYNSAVCELVTGETSGEFPSKRAIYDVAPELYKIKEEIEKHLCQVTDNLFNLTNRIMIFDLTNFFYEGRKLGSKKAQFGRSKERRSDCNVSSQ